MLFDSDIVIWASRGDFAAANMIDSDTRRSISIVGVMEILQGARSILDMRFTQQYLREIGFRVVPLSERIGDTAATLIEEHALSGGLRVVDALVAATAMATGDVLATANTRHFRTIPSLELRAFRPSSA
jgi:predicted nucleic acid-binding protein